MPRHASHMPKPPKPKPSSHQVSLEGADTQPLLQVLRRDAVLLHVPLQCHMFKRHMSRTQRRWKVRSWLRSRSVSDHDSQPKRSMDSTRVLYTATFASSRAGRYAATVPQPPNWAKRVGRGVGSAPGGGGGVVGFRGVGGGAPAAAFFLTPHTPRRRG
jgi:hypothetical protein